MFEVHVVHLINVSDGHNKYYNIMSIKSASREGLVAQNWGALGKKSAGYGKTFHETAPYVFDFHFTRKQKAKINDGYTVEGATTRSFETSGELRNFISGARFSGASFIGTINANLLEAFIEESEDISGTPLYTEPEDVAKFAEAPTMKEGILLEHGEDCTMRGSW